MYLQAECRLFERETNTAQTDILCGLEVGCVTDEKERERETNSISGNLHFHDVTDCYRTLNVVVVIQSIHSKIPNRSLFASFFLSSTVRALCIYQHQ